MINGIEDPAERYDLEVDWDKTHVDAGKIRVVFTLANTCGRSGTLSLMVLYKEWKLTGEVTGFGAFSGTDSPKQALTLILQGRGNSCTRAEDFTHWTLVTEGPKGTYSLFGELVR